MALNISPHVRSNMVVTRHGNRFIRCGKGRKPYGIFHEASSARIETDAGLITHETPRGIVRRGSTLVVIAP